MSLNPNHRREPVLLGGTGALSSGSVPAPTNLIATPFDFSTIDVQWDEVEGATYNVYRGLAADSLVLLASGVADPQYGDVTVVSGTLYFYAVKAVIDSEESSFSNVDSATPPP